MQQEEVWTATDEAAFRPLYQKWQRIRSKQRLDKLGRTKKFGARPQRRKSLSINEDGSVSLERNGKIVHIKRLKK